MLTVQTGLEKFNETPPKSISKNRLGLLCNPASIDSKFRHARYVIDALFPGSLKALFSPQHGFFAARQDNMIESPDITDPVLKIPVFSLYSRSRIPTKEMFDLIDLLIIDLQDVGTRVYTFIYTMSYCLETAKKLGKKVIVLDRPNPINGISIEGNILSPQYASFVGRYPIPMRHGLTIGEIAILFNDCFNIGCDLEVVTMKGWDRSMYFKDTGLPWIPPSPNLPTPVSAMVYPGQVLWEGTNLSEGRGTSQPFEIFGAPFLNTDKILTSMGGNRIAGGYLRETAFEPTSNKWENQICRGFQIHVTNPDAYLPFATSLNLLRAVLINHINKFKWKQPPYEYEFNKMPIDLILGDGSIRKRIEIFDEVNEIEATWEKSMEQYKSLRDKILLYC